jgi:hypothetical protein
MMGEQEDEFEIPERFKLTTNTSTAKEKGNASTLLLPTANGAAEENLPW